MNENGDLTHTKLRCKLSTPVKMGHSGVGNPPRLHLLSGHVDRLIM